MSPTNSGLGTFPLMSLWTSPGQYELCGDFKNHEVMKAGLLRMIEKKKATRIL